MTVLLEQFVQTLSESGLMTAEDVKKFLEEVPAGEAPSTGEQLAQLLFRRGKLTKYQTQAVYQGKAKGLILGDYVILEQIGAGGMGQVFKARHRRMKRVVALKILPAETTKSESAVMRFQQEVEAAAKLIHQNVATAFDAGETNNVHFLVMEYVDGKDLAGMVEERGSLPLAETLNYVLQAARGLKYAHDEGVVHRDIKPANLLVDKNGTIKILDLGLARSATQVDDGRSTAAAGLTRSGDVMGTVDYMSPEQASSTKHVDGRADIYSLGCTLFFLLNARPVFEGQTLVERVLAHREKPPPSLSELRKEVPRTWDSVFRKMVAKKPEQRFQTMADVITSLEKLDMPQGTADGGVKPVPAARANAETRASTLTARTNPVEPPAERKLSPKQKMERALRQVQEQQKREEQKKAWQDAVESAVDEQRSALGLTFWARFRRIVGETTITLFKWALILVLLVGGGYGGFFLWTNFQHIRHSRQQVVTVLNNYLGQQLYDPLGTIEFQSVSVLQIVPETLVFERPLYQTGASGHRQTGMLRGEFQRTKGIIKLSEPSAIELKTEPVP